jgi:hypothetical protein
MRGFLAQGLKMLMPPGVVRQTVVHVEAGGGAAHGLDGKVGDFGNVGQARQQAALAGQRVGAMVGKQCDQAPDALGGAAAAQGGDLCGAARGGGHLRQRWRVVRGARYQCARCQRAGGEAVMAEDQRFEADHVAGQGQAGEHRAVRAMQIEPHGAGYDAPDLAVIGDAMDQFAALVASLGCRCSRQRGGRVQHTFLQFGSSLAV